MKRLKILTVISLLLSIILFSMEKQKTIEDITSGNLPKEWFQENKTPLTPKEHIRPADQTFLTFPEWFLVHSPREEANYLKTRTSSSFPFIGHLSQLWKSYEIVNKQIKPYYEFNGGYHLMIMVISVSTTVEYGLKSVYENTIGRMTDTKIGEELTEEDKFQAIVLDEYVKFILQTPWYEFDFANSIKKLWTEVPIYGNNLVRKIERRFFLTTDLGIKSIYGWLIKKATKSIYEDPILGTAVVVDRIPSKLKNNIKVLKEGDEYSILLLPRYADFNPAAISLAKQNIEIKEIAGNKGAILLTILAPEEYNFEESKKFQSIFVQHILTDFTKKRIAIVCLVTNLPELLRKLSEEKIFVEHIYDY
ncbi:MAG: hypothetical protein SFU98_09775 [Leptospiraceae bacterium]|nr:hypothetical protein [Leptospiraceae bacterium]